MRPGGRPRLQQQEVVNGREVLGGILDKQEHEEMNRQRIRQSPGHCRVGNRLPIVRGSLQSTRVDWRLALGISLICWVLLASAVPALSAEEAKHLFRIGTGGALAVYYPIGK